MAKSTQPIKQAILALIKQHQKANSKVLKLTDREFNYHVFRNHTISLTRAGFMLLSKIVTPYEFAHDNEFKTQHLLALSNLKHPYYVSDTKFVVFSSEDAIMINLHENITTFLEQSNLFRG